MRYLLVLALLPAGLSCVDSGYYYGEEFAGYYRRPAEETSTERTDRREIVHWASNPKDKRRIGFLYQYETLVRGSRELRPAYQIWNVYGNKALGLITDEGKFYRYDANGRPEIYVGEYKIVTTGLKVFFGIPVRENVDLEDIDPFK
jgi:hypothetical protein